MNLLRVDRNGIRVLDDPKANRLPSRRKCLPTEHRYKYKADGISDYGETWTEFECKLCGETDTRWSYP